MIKKIFILFILVLSFTGCNLLAENNSVMLIDDGQIRNSTGGTVLDGNNFIMEDYLHNLNELGRIYSVKEYFGTVSNNDNVSIMIKTNGQRVHLVEYIVTMGDRPDDIFLFENPTISSNGNQTDIITKNRAVQTNSTALVFRDPTVTDFGTELDRDLLIGSKDQEGQIRRVPYHWILESNSTYLIVGNNRGGGTAEVMFNVIWYEGNK